jgi:hypothetical protein
MGTQNAWGGSRGRDWSRVRDDAEALVANPTSGNAEALLPQLGSALDWFDSADGDVPPADGAPPPGGASVPPIAAPLPAGPTWSSHLRLSGGGGGGGGTGGTRSSGGRSSGSGGTSRGGGRSRARAASVGGRALAAASAYQRGDAETLQSLGLDLDELRSLSGLKRINAILNATVGADGGIEDTELRKVNVRVLKSMLTDDINGVEAVRLYIVEYVMQVWASETGEAIRNGQHAAGSTAQSERQLRGALAARARRLTIAASSTAAEFRDAIASSMTYMRRLMGET